MRHLFTRISPRVRVHMTEEERFFRILNFVRRKRREALNCFGWCYRLEGRKYVAFKIGAKP